MLLPLPLAAAAGPVRRPNLGEHRHRSVVAEAKAAPVTPEDPPIIKPYEPIFGFLVLNGFYVTRWVLKGWWGRRWRRGGYASEAAGGQQSSQDSQRTSDCHIL